MDKPTVETHPKHPDWITITQLDVYFSEIADIHIKKSDIPEFIKKLNEYL